MGEMLETNRCKLFKIQKTDYEEVRTLYMDERVRQFLGGVVDQNIYKTKFAGMCNKNNNDLFWVIRRKEDDQFIGLVSLDIHHDGINTEISYQLLPKWWGQGYGIEVVQHIISYGFKELGLKTIVAETQSVNKASSTLLERVGMNLDKTVERFGEKQSIFSINNI